MAQKKAGKIFQILLFVITMLWTFVIFSFSLQSSSQSSELSGGIVAWLVSDVFAYFFGDISNLEHLVRKAAHFGEYFVLGFLSTTTVLHAEKEPVKAKNKKFIYAITYGVMVSMIDEIIQRFVPGRSSQILDVLLDSAGVFCGVILFFICYKVKNIAYKSAMRIK